MQIASEMSLSMEYLSITIKGVDANTIEFRSVVLHILTNGIKKTGLGKQWIGFSSCP